MAEKKRYGLIAGLVKKKGKPSQENFGKNVAAPFKKKKK